MEMTVRMPANYNLMSEDEMTYTTGGAAGAADVISVASAAVSIVAGVYAVYSTIWGLTGARNWLAANKGGDLMTTLDKAVNDGVAYATSSVGTLIRSCVALMGMTTVWPITAIALITA